MDRCQWHHCYSRQTAGIFPSPLRYNLWFDLKYIIMEAERLDSLSALLADLKTREVELRRYL